LTFKKEKNVGAREEADYLLQEGSSARLLTAGRESLTVGGLKKLSECWGQEEEPQVRGEILIEVTLSIPIQRGAFG